MSAQTRGGGNCANALTTAARLGLDTHLVSKIGDDSIGEEIEQELSADGVKTGFLLKAKGHPSPFTYIIVDKQGRTFDIYSPLQHTVAIISIIHMT